MSGCIFLLTKLKQRVQNIEVQNTTVQSSPNIASEYTMYTSKSVNLSPLVVLF